MKRLERLKAHVKQDVFATSACTRLSCNFLVAVRPWAFIWTSTEESESEPSSTASTSTASPALSVTICA